jgi:hypothetical protein
MYCKDASSNIQQQINAITSNPIFGNVAPNIGISVFTQNVVFEGYTTFNGDYNFINGYTVITDTTNFSNALLNSACDLNLQYGTV